MSRYNPSNLLLLLTALATCGQLRAIDSNHYVYLRQIILNREAQIDCIAVGSESRRAYISGRGTFVTLDLDSDKINGELAESASGYFAIAPEMHLRFVCDEHASQFSVFGLADSDVRAKGKTGKTPRSILFVPQTSEVYTFNVGDNTASVFEADDADFEENIHLPGKPGAAVNDPVDNWVYCTIFDKDEIASINVKKRMVVGEWSTTPGKGPVEAVMDVANHRCFVGCTNNVMVVIDTSNGKLVTSVPIGKDVGGVEFDPETKLVFASCGDGTVTIAHEDSPNKFTVVQTLKTESGARRMALDTKTHKIYILANGIAKQKNSDTATGSGVLVYGMKASDK